MVRINGMTPHEVLVRLVAKRGEQVLKLDGSPVPRENVVYVGRPSKWGNPFTHKPGSSAPWRVETAQQAVDAYRIWLEVDEEPQRELRAAIGELEGKVLVCTCQSSAEEGPPCHAEVLVRLANPWLAEHEHDVDPALTPRKLDLRYASHLTEWLRRQEIAEPKVVLVTGDRDFKAVTVIEEQIRRLAPGTVVIEGEARGADVLAREKALEAGLPVGGFPAQWRVTRSTPAHRIGESGGRRWDKAAGPIRNARMLEAGPDRVLAFHDDLAGSLGTKDMVRRAVEAGITVELVNSRGEVHELDAQRFRELTSAPESE